jgi:glycogen debranching enzyme
LNRNAHICLSAFLSFLVLIICSTPQAKAQSGLIAKFTLSKSGLELERRTQAGSFFDVLGRKSAVFGYENRACEAWVYPMKILDDFKLAFNLQGYPLDIDGADISVSINVRPEATTFTYAHAAFTVRQIIFAPVDEQGVIMLLDVQSVLPLTITGSFRPKLKLMWPAGLMTGFVGWDERAHLYFTGEESQKFFGVVGSPLARDISVQPYQEEPRDVPLRFVIEPSPEIYKSHYIPIVIAGSTEGQTKARETYQRLLTNAPALYEKNVAYYKALNEKTASIVTPDARLNEAFAWAKVGIDKGLATNPMLGTGLLAGFRTSGDSERPGFAWYFGRDSMWTALAINAYGDYAAARTAIEFLKKFQRDDGKIPHEISQSAALLDWFKGYPYAWASADATPLYLIANADYWRTSGDLDFIRKNWSSILRAYRFTAATDTDGNGLIENSGVGHGWVEGGALSPPHEELYMQGVWVAAQQGLAQMAEALEEKDLRSQLLYQTIPKTLKAIEEIYWLPQSGFYAFATNRPPASARTAEAGPNRAVRQTRMNEIDRQKIIDEDTVLPAVPMWWRVLDETRAQSELDHLGSGAMATDWGARILSKQSKLYDPLSYHYGSVWPLFTGWQAMAAYNYGRPQVGYQALMANALLTYSNASGYVTELLSGDFNRAFGRSSHHQVWSSAMVVAPVMKGLLGIQVSTAGKAIHQQGGKALYFAPQLPAFWDKVEVKNVPVGAARFQITLERTPGRLVITMRGRVPEELSGNKTMPVTPEEIIVAPAFPLDARVKSVTVDGHPGQFKIEKLGDIQRASVNALGGSGLKEIIFNYDEGTEVFAEQQIPAVGALSQGLRVLRSRVENGALNLLLEGLGGRAYDLRVKSPYQLSGVDGIYIIPVSATETRINVTFDGAGDSYIRRAVRIPLTAKR